jgi:uncharacterized radical SAM superfamily Fe-S cluster-containing enzyme
MAATSVILNYIIILKISYCHMMYTALGDAMSTEMAKGLMTFQFNLNLNFCYCHVMYTVLDDAM